MSYEEPDNWCGHYTLVDNPRTAMRFEQRVLSDGRVQAIQVEPEASVRRC